MHRRTEYDYDVTVLLLWSSHGVQTIAIDDGDIGKHLESGDSLTIMGHVKLARN